MELEVEKVNSIEGGSEEKSNIDWNLKIQEYKCSEACFLKRLILSEWIDVFYRGLSHSNEEVNA